MAIFPKNKDFDENIMTLWFYIDSLSLLLPLIKIPTKILTHMRIFNWKFKDYTFEQGDFLIWSLKSCVQLSNSPNIHIVLWDFNQSQRRRENKSRKKPSPKYFQDGRRRDCILVDERAFNSLKTQRRSPESHWNVSSNVGKYTYVF